MTETSLLQILQLADSAVPIGGAAHSFGLEMLTAAGAVSVPTLEAFLRDYLAEAGALEAAFCRRAHRLAPVSDFAESWLALNAELGAFKPARESRAASATLGRRFLQLATSLSGDLRLAEALDTARQERAEIHHATAFGLVGGRLGWTEDMTAVTYLQQNVMALVSAAQRLLPLGQNQASGLLWHLQPSVQKASASPPAPEAVPCFTPLLDVASMRHPHLTTRLFIS